MILVLNKIFFTYYHFILVQHFYNNQIIYFSNERHLNETI